MATEPQAEWHMVVITVANKVLMDKGVAMEDIPSITHHVTRNEVRALASIVDINGVSAS